MIVDKKILSNVLYWRIKNMNGSNQTELKGIISIILVELKLTVCRRFTFIKYPIIKLVWNKQVIINEIDFLSEK